MDRLENEKGLAGHEDSFNPIFPSLQNVSEDSGHRNYLDAPSPYRLNADVSSDEALKQIRTANTISISPGIYWAVLSHSLEGFRTRNGCADTSSRAF